MKIIHLSNGKEVKVDDEDFEILSKFNWNESGHKHTKYAETHIYPGKIAKGVYGRTKRVFMHRVLMKPSETEFIDHIDRNGLNNQKLNLRICTKSQNARNTNSRKNSTSIYLGVALHKATGKWQASISDNKKIKYLGVFINEIDAAKAYDEAAKKYHKQFANLNFK